MTSVKYSTSFSVGAIFYHESIICVEQYLKLGEWSTVKDFITENNSFQARTTATSQRIYWEIHSRLKLLSEEQLKLLIDGTHKDKKHILWLAICKKYDFIKDFMIDIVCEKYLNLKSDLSYEDFDIFFDEKAEWHEELSKLTEATRKKLRRVLFKILRDIGIVTKENKIVTAVPSPTVIQAINNSSPTYLNIFTAPDSEIKAGLK
jgi:hypothetical protein